MTERRVDEEQDSDGGPLVYVAKSDYEWPQPCSCTT